MRSAASALRGRDASSCSFQVATEELDGPLDRVLLKVARNLASIADSEYSRLRSLQTFQKYRPDQNDRYGRKERKPTSDRHARLDCVW
jgi:hypothetical protein